MNKEDINQIIKKMPKKFCDGAFGNHSKEFFNFGFTSGEVADGFATTPQVMKSISLWLNGQIDMYEKKFGIIDMTPQEIQSPIQISDLNSGDSK